MPLQPAHDVKGGLHVLLVVENGELGSTSGRTKYFVACLVCRKILHWSTTSYATWVKQHLEGKPAAYEEDRSADWGKDPPDPETS